MRFCNIAMPSQFNQDMALSRRERNAGYSSHFLHSVKGKTFPFTSVHDSFDPALKFGQHADMLFPSWVAGIDDTIDNEQI